MIKDTKGFTYIEVLLSILILCFFIGFYIHTERYIYTQRIYWDETDKMTMAAQGVMNAYKSAGKATALTLGQGYTVNIIETTIAGNLKKITVIVTPTISSMSNITLVSYFFS